MKGLEEARLIYEERGRDMISRCFPEYEGRIAAGLAGHGSECFGFDDEVSRDHDFSPGFSIWIDDELDLKIGVALAREYRRICPDKAGQSSALAENVRGIHRISDYFRRYTGCAGAPESWQQWLYLPSHALAEAVNGQVFRDDAGIFSSIRNEIRYGMPEDVRIKKIAARAIEMAQSGQYNYSRCLKHGEEGAAVMALSRFISSACEMIYLLNKSYMPYYKWMFRGMDSLEKLGNYREPLEFLLCSENDEEGKKLKKEMIEDICAGVIREIQAQKLSCGAWDYLEPHALDIMSHHIQNPEIRSLHVMEG